MSAENPEKPPQSATRGRGELRVPKHGRGKLRTGGTNKGGTGRPTKKFTTFMRELRESPDVQDAIERAAKDEKSKGFMPVLRALAEYDDEKPAQKQQITGPVEVTVRIQHEGRRVTAS